MENISLAINVTLVGLIVVFLSLIILSLIISLFPKFLTFGNKQNTTSVIDSDDSYEITEEHFDESNSEDSNDSLVAILTAAILATMGNRPDVNIRVKSFKRIPQSSPVWNSTGRKDYISNKL